MKREEYEWEVRGPIALAVRVSTGEILLRITRDNDGVWSFWKTFAAQYPMEQIRRLCEFKDADSAMAAFEKWMADEDSYAAERHRIYLERQQKALEEFAKPAEKKRPWYRRLFR